MKNLWIVAFLLLLALALADKTNANDSFGLTPTPEPVATEPPVFELPGTIPFMRPKAYLPVVFGGENCPYWLGPCREDFR